MRWTLIILLSVAVASAQYEYGKKNRIGQMLKDIEDFGEELKREFDSDESVSSEDSAEMDDSDEDDMWREPRHSTTGRREQRKQCKNCQTKKHTKRDPREEDDFDGFDQFEDSDDGYDQEQRQQRRKPKKEPEDGPCQPKKTLIPKLGQLNTHLAARLYQEAKQSDDDKNLVVSPVSVQLSLAALAQGARGNTKRQLNQILDISLPKNQNQNAYAALARALKGQDDQTEGKVAQIKCSTNLILGQQSAREQFIEAIKTCFDGEVKKCDFRQKPQQCRDQIEQWITSKTGIKPPNTLSRATVTERTKMITIGTTQIKTKWGKQFRKSLKTAQGQFFALGEQKASTVKVLQTEGTFNYFEDEQMQVLGVQTQEKQLTVYILLPKDRHGLNKIDKQRIQYGKQLEQILTQCDSSKRTLKVQVPQFQVVHKLEEAKRVLKKLGVQDAFDGDEADFSGITEGRRQTGGLEDIDIEKAKEHYKQEHVGRLHLNKMIQLASIQVDENGIDSASNHKTHSTTAKLHHRDTDDDDDNDDLESGRDQFKVDHAFAFIIKHNPTKQIVMIGRVIDVTQKPVNDTHETE